MPTQNDIRNAITEKIVEAVKNGTPPWRKPWSDVADPVRFPTNIVSGRAYRGINTLLLQLEATEKGFPVGLWASYRQMTSLGQQVRRGERSTQVVYYKQLTKTRINEKGVEEKTTFPLLRTWNVFNISQTDGPLADKYLTPATTAQSGDSDHHEFFNVIAATGADVRYGGNRAAYYRSPHDYIQMPKREQFDSSPRAASEFADTLSHEIIHWAGSEHRLKRELTYAQEELVAEIGAAFLLQSTGVPHPDLNNSSSYVASWLKETEGQDARFIFKAASMASDAVDYIHGFINALREADSESELVADAV